MSLRKLKNTINNKTMQIAFMAVVALMSSSIAKAQLATDDSTATSITLNWTAPGDDGNNGIASEYDIRYSTVMINEGNWGAAIQISDESVPLAAGSAESYTVQNLQPSTTYYFGIKSQDEANNQSGLSNVAVKTTGAETVPPSDISSLLASHPSLSSVNLAWTAPGDDGNLGTASQYDIRYSTATINDANWNSATPASGEPTPQIAGSQESFTVSSLQSGTTYYFAIKTMDDASNWSGLSNITNATTMSDEDTTPPQLVADFAIDTLTENSASLTWTAPGDDGNIGQASVYDVRYNTVTITNSNWGHSTPVNNEPVPQPAGSDESFTITGLNEGTTYYFAIKTYDEVPNYSLLSNIAFGTTENEAIAPVAITSLQVSVANEDNVELTWIAPGDDGDQGTASQYDVRYSLLPITLANWGAAVQATNEPSPSPAGSEESFTVAGLDGEVRYYFAIKAADEVPNWSNLSNVVNVITPDQTPPSAIGDLSALSGENIGSVSIEWTAPGDDDNDGIAELYVIKYHSEPLDEANWDLGIAINDPPTPLESGSAQAIEIGGLNPGQYYYLAIKTEDDYGNLSEMSNVASAEAKPFGSNAIDDLVGLPEYFDLSQNYPNPFNPTTSIDFALPTPSHVRLDVYDSNGRFVANLSDHYYQAGYHNIVWDGRQSSGRNVSTGVYFYHLVANDFESTKKMLLLK